MLLFRKPKKGWHRVQQAPPRTFGESRGTFSFLERHLDVFPFSGGPRPSHAYGQVVVRRLGGTLSFNFKRGWNSFTNNKRRC